MGEKRAIKRNLLPIAALEKRRFEMAFKDKWSTELGQAQRNGRNTRLWKQRSSNKVGL